jgi:endonuclease YncB( thermonuclease family)
VATWVVDGRTVRLLGIDPGPPKHLASLVNWVRAKGAVECLLQWPTQLYRCFTATGEDIAEAALLAGIGRTGEGATAAYQSAESNARRMGKGLWARR